jgi:hypothetical protein
LKKRENLDVAIIADRNATHKEAENKLKYKSLCTKINEYGA